MTLPCGCQRTGGRVQPSTGVVREQLARILASAEFVASDRLKRVLRQLLGSNMSAASDAEAAAPGDVPDAAKLYAAAKKLSTFLISRSAIVPVAAAALLALVAAGATQLPVRELLKIAKGLLLL